MHLRSDIIPVSVVNKNTPFMGALGLRPSSRNCNPATDSVLFRADVQTGSLIRRSVRQKPECTHSHMVAASSDREAMTKQMFEDR